MSRHSFHQDNGKNSSDLSATALRSRSLLGGMSLPAGCFCLSDKDTTQRSLLRGGLMQEEVEGKVGSQALPPWCGELSFLFNF